jgi:predicted Rossmann fold nucleotide-binding protein DprA/Smf involved in DNA uptake
MRNLLPVQLLLGNVSYPQPLYNYLKTDAPLTVYALGDLSILDGEKVGLFCSIKCPGNVILRLYDAAREWRDNGVTIISGFHSPMEKECLEILLRGDQPIIICPARGIENMRLPKTWIAALEQKRLLLLSPFDPKHRHVTADLAQKRNLFIAALADKILIAHIAAGGKTESFAQTIRGWGKKLLPCAV